MEITGFLYGLDEKIDRIYNTCQMFIEADLDRLRDLSQLSIYPTFLFDGYPGTGKSSVASLVYEKLKCKFNVDLYRLNVDELLSHNFGESSKNLRKYFDNIISDINRNNSHCVVIMDEIDSFTTSRYKDSNEVIKRVLLTFNTIVDELVRNGDIFRIVTIATTNIRESIDISVLRRFYFLEDFNAQLDFLEFSSFIKKINLLAKVKYQEPDFLEQVYASYLEKKFSLGEIKSVFSKAYIDNIISPGASSLSSSKFQDLITFHEMAKKQLGR